MKKLKLGINACRARSGGMKTHLHGILRNLDNDFLESYEIIVWAYPDLLTEFSLYQNIQFKTNKYLSGGLLSQLFWELVFFKEELISSNIDILLSLDGAALVSFDKHVVMSRDMLSYEPGILDRYSMGYQKLRILALKFVQNVAFRRATCVIFLTEYAKEVIVKSCGKLSSYTIIPHGVSNEFRNVVHCREYKGGDVRNILFTSTIDIYKNQWNVVEAVSVLRSKGYKLNLHLVGGVVNDRAYKLTKDAIAKFDTDGLFVTHHGHLSHVEMSKFMVNMDLFCYASSCETMPNTLIEAMCVGLPIVCSNKGPMPEILKDAGIYFDPYSVAEIVEAIESVINNEELLSTLSKRAKEYSKIYSWKACSDRTFSLLESVLDKRSKIED